MNTHKSTIRSATENELAHIKSFTNRDYFSWGCLTIFIGIIPFFLFGYLGEWIGGFISYEKEGKYVGRTLSIIFFIVSLKNFSKYEKDSRTKNHKDLEAKKVEEIKVTTDKVYSIALINDNEPILAFDIGENKVLYLQGQWLRDYETYGLKEDPSENDEGDNFINSLPEPYSFPQNTFTLIRSIHGGQVIQIKLQGSYLEPSKEVDVLKEKYDFNDSEVLDGKLVNLEQILEQKHKSIMNKIRFRE